MSIAGREGFNYDEIEDLRMAVSEIVRILLGSEFGTSDDTGQIAIGEVADRRHIDATFSMQDATLYASFTLPDAAVVNKLKPLSRQILEATTTTFTVDVDVDDGNRATIQFWKSRDPRPS